MTVPFAFLRGRKARVRQLFREGAEKRFVDPPLPFVPIERLDTPNGDHLASFFVEASGSSIDRGNDSIGSAFFALCKPTYDAPTLCLMKIPRRFFEAVAALDDDAIERIACVLFPLKSAVPRNPFTKKPTWTRVAYRAHIRDRQDETVLEIASFRKFFREALEESERIYCWVDLR